MYTPYMFWYTYNYLNILLTSKCTHKLSYSRIFQKLNLCFKMNKANMDLQKDKSESQDIYHTLCNSRSMYDKCLHLEFKIIRECVNNTLDLLINDDFHIVAGSTAEGTNINSQDYGKYFHSMTPCYISDVDFINILYEVQVIDEGDTLPQRFDNHIYCRAEKGIHTTDGFRKLRIVYSPGHYSIRQYKAILWENFINMSVEHGYISSSTFLATTVSQMRYLPSYEWPIKPDLADLGTQGPSKMIEIGGSAADLVTCLYVKTWPKEADSWFTRQTHWPDKQLKSKIKKTGYLLVATGNSKSQESDLEWRCSFSIAEKILFQSMNTFQICTFIILKILLKEYLPADINTDGEKQLLSTYHIKTLFLWSLEDRQLVWEPEHMLNIIAHMFEKLLRWIKQQYFPHYFIPSVNLFDGRRLHGRENSLSYSLSEIRNDLSNKIKQSQFFAGQKINQFNLRHLASTNHVCRWLFCNIIHQYVMKPITGKLQEAMQYYVLGKNLFQQYNLSHSMLLEGLISIKPDIDVHTKHLYRALYSDLVHDKLLTEVMPGLINQYQACSHFAKYCIAARDGCVLPDVLHTAESLLKDTLHLDPCSGYVKLACLYIATGNLVCAMHKLDIAENNFLYTYQHMEISAFIASRVVVNAVPTHFFFKEVFQEWAEGNVTSYIVVTWPEYITVPDLLQFEFIHESTKHVFYESDKPDDGRGKIVKLHFRLQWPPLSMIKLLKFVCTFNSSQSFTSHMENLVTDLIVSSLHVSVFQDVNDIYTVFNMAAWCYVKIKKYKQATHMMTVAIDSSSQSDVMKRCAFSHNFLAYCITQCLL